MGLEWEFPGGKVSSNETFVEALNREIKEELNVCVSNQKRLPSVQHEYSHFKVKIFPYSCLYTSGKVKLNIATQFQWINMSTIKNFSFPRATHKVFELIK